jgi:hypothetical protein
VVDAVNALAGQALDAPVQFSAGSQTPLPERQTVVDAANESAGHAPAPLQPAGSVAVPLEQEAPRQLVDDPG